MLVLVCGATMSYTQWHQGAVVGWMWIGLGFTEGKGRFGVMV